MKNTQAVSLIEILLPGWGYIIAMIYLARFKLFRSKFRLLSPVRKA